ncbi:Replication protein E1, partial [Stenotrophomonas maltophilia]
NGTYWQAISDAEGVGVASDWIDRNADFAGSPKLAKDCWDMASLRLRQKNPMPTQAKRAIVPVADGYVEILPDGFHVLAPDPALGMTHAVRVACGGRQGHAYKPQPLPADSRFAKFLCQAHDDPRVIDLLQEQCGMTLLPGVYSQAAWWHGVAGSGKSTLAEIVEAMHRQVARCNLETLG